MGGIQIEHLLKLIDNNIQVDSTLTLRFIQDHAEEIRHQLETQGHIDIPTASGIVTFQRAELEAADQTI